MGSRRHLAGTIAAAAALAACAAITGVGDLVPDTTDAGADIDAQAPAPPPPPPNVPPPPPPPPVAPIIDAGTDAAALLYPCNAPDLIAFWSANDEAGTTLHDCSPEKNDGQLTAGVSFVAGRSGRNALHFTGNTDQVSFGAAGTMQLATRGAFTISLWASIDPADVKGSIMGRAATFDQTGWSLSYVSGAAVRGKISDTGAVPALDLLAGPQAVTPLAFAHISLVFRPGIALELWTGGKLAFAANGAPAMTPSYNPFQMGFIPDSTDRYGHAQNLSIQDVRFFGRALTAAEIGVLAKEP